MNLMIQIGKIMDSEVLEDKRRVDIAGYAACGAECDGFEAEAKAD